MPSTARSASGIVARCHTTCGLLALAPCLLLPPVLMAASSTLALQVSSETAPAGGWVQMKIAASTPALIARGRLVIDFDPGFFDTVLSPGVFGSNTDAYGVVTITGLHLDAQFASPAGGIGRIVGLPVFVVSAHVIRTLPSGATTAVKPDSNQGPWSDVSGNPYTVSITPGAATIGGSVSIQYVAPGEGYLPAGAVIGIGGAG